MNKKEKPMTEKVAEWLKDQGYPLEMSVAAEFQKADFSVSLSNFYKDYETKKLREIDVTAVKWSDLERSSALQVCWCIECKLALKNPWVVFVSSVQPERFLPFTTFVSSTYRVSLMKAYADKDFRSKLFSSPLIQHYTGYGITQAFTSTQDIPYKAVMSATKASLDTIKQFDKMETELVESIKKQFLCISFPVVVIDGKLLDCIEIDDELTITEVESSALFWCF